MRGYSGANCLIGYSPRIRICGGALVSIFCIEKQHVGMLLYRMCNNNSHTIVVNG